MLISDQEIENWADLQQKVSDIFREMNYEVEIEKKVILGARGKKEIDVWVRDSYASLNQVYLVECKFWDSNVPQEVIHGFRTIMQDAGANTGIIISKVGFNKGAYEAIEYTNIHLMTFQEFQHTYGNEWFRKKKENLIQLREKLKYHYSLHFDFNRCDNNIWNNRYFFSKNQKDQLPKYYKSAANLLLLSAGNYPRTYNEDDFSCLNSPFDPPINGAWATINKTYSCKSVRQFFSDMELALTEWVESFELFYADAINKYENLTEEERSNIDNHAFELMVNQIK